MQRCVALVRVDNMNLAVLLEAQCGSDLTLQSFMWFRIPTVGH